MFFSNYGKTIKSIDDSYNTRLAVLKKSTQEDTTYLSEYIPLLKEYEYFLNDRIVDLYWERGELEVTLVERKSILYCHDPKRRNEGWSEWVNLGLDDAKFKKKMSDLVLVIKDAESYVLS